MITLETDRLTLRMLRESDLDAYAQMCADPEVMRYIGDGQPLARPMAWRNLALMVGHWSLRGYGLWAVEERSSGALVGRIGFWNPEGWPGFELGWMLHRSFWGRGYATEGARAALEFAFSQIQQPHVISLIHPANAASIRVAQRLGERLVDCAEVMGKPALVYRVMREEWASSLGERNVTDSLRSQEVPDVTQLPFNRLLGLEPEGTDSGFLISLPDGPQYTNHLGTVHAGALLAVAESGAGAFLVRQLGSGEGYVPVVRRLEAKFRKPASGRLSARAVVPPEELARWSAELTARGRISAAVPVEVVDAAGVVVLSAVVEWFIARG